MFALLVTLAVLVAFSFIYLRGENLDYLDSGSVPAPTGEPSPQHADVVASMGEFASQSQGLGRKERLQAIRNYMDSIGDDREFASKFSAQSSPVKGEWVIAPESDPKRRILYIHGGAWLAGSPKSHRIITDRLARLCNASVFSLDYRLLPEHTRAQGIDDCYAAYRWILETGPEGEAELVFLMVAGDSAGGILTLATVAWARDQGLRAADAAVAFSPSTDVTMTSPSLRSNVSTDPMLGPGFGKLLKVPPVLLWWGSWITNRIPPSDPRVSPLRGDLAGLPPILIQASEAEMLFDDARRYAAKAKAAGSNVQLQTWPHMVHVWQIFSPELPEAEDAFAKIAVFIDALAPAEAGAHP